MNMPAQQPGKSKQDYGTPLEFLEAVERRIAPIGWDLASDGPNSVVPYHDGMPWCYTPEDDSLAQDWTEGARVKWLNPPFANIAPWAKKCAESVVPGKLILLLTPASIGARWFAEYVHGKAYVLALTPRLTFRGCTTPYPKDCMLSVYGWAPGFDVWEWKERQ